MNESEFLIVNAKGDKPGQYRCNMVSQKSHISMINSLRLFIDEYFADINPSSTLNEDAFSVEAVKNSLTRHILTGVIASNITEEVELDKVLFVPNWKESDHTSLFVDATAVNPINKSNIGHFMQPIVAKYFNVTTDYYIAMPVGDSLFKHLYNSFGCEVIESNKQYALDVEDWTVSVHESVGKFDGVILSGIEANGKTYSKEDVKSDFASLCTSDFKLIDSWEHHDMRIALHNGKTYAQAIADGITIPERITGATALDLTTIISFSNTNSIPASHHNNVKLAALLNRTSKSQADTYRVY